MKKLTLISVLTLLPLVSFAAIDIQKNNNGVTLTTSRNVYLAGNIINVFQEEPGDVYAVGSMVSITGKINQDLFVIGGNITITSQIVGDLRVAAGNINLTGPVDGDLIAAGGQIEIAPSSVIKGDFLAAGGKMNIGGSMNGNGKIFGKEVYISGTLNKDIDIKANSLVIEKTAVINGNINYKGEKEATINEGAKIIGKISFTKIEAKPAKAGGLAAVLGIFGILWLIKFFALLVAALVLFFLTKQNISKIAAEAVDNFWKKLLGGFVLVIVIPAAVIVLFLTVIGLALGVLGLALYALLLILGMVFAGIITAELLNQLFFRGERAKPLKWPMVILGVIVMQLLTFIPVVGWIATFIIFLVGFGTVSNLLYRQVKTVAE